jgi:hypothetical protein
VYAVAVRRRGFDVFHTPVSRDEALAMEGAAAGHSLASTWASFSEQEDPAAAAHAALESWIQEGWIAGLADPAPES